MFGFHPFGIHDVRNQHIRVPPRTAPPPLSADPSPRISIDEASDAYTVIVNAPAMHTINKPRATSEGSRFFIVAGTLVPNELLSRYEYITRARAGLYAHRDQCSLVSVLPAGMRIAGRAPSKDGWIKLADENAWLLDDGSVGLVSRAASRAPLPFAKKVELPAEDADMRRATKELLGKDGLIFRIPRIRRVPATATTPYKIPVNVKRAPQSPAPAAPKPPPTASKPSPAAHKSTGPQTRTADVHAEDLKQQHKRPAAAARQDTVDRSALSDSAGPVLTEVSASARNVQSPTEHEAEEWLATSNGTFVRSTDGSPLSERMRREGRGVAAHAEKEAQAEEANERSKGSKRFRPLVEMEERVKVEADDEWVDVTMPEPEEEQMTDGDEYGDGELAFWGF